MDDKTIYMDILKIKKNLRIQKLFFLLFCFFLCIQCNNTKIKLEEKPNILWLVIEDMSPQFIGAYGNTSSKTPVIDSLLNEGIKFNSAFSTGSVCSASRYSIITGTRTFEYGTGHHRSNYPIPNYIEPFPKFLKEAGYHTSNNSKRDYNTSDRWRITKSAWIESADTAGWWNRNKKPFFSVFNFNNSHQSRTFTNPYKNYEKRILNKLHKTEIILDNEIILPDYYIDTPELRREMARTYNAMKKTDNEINELIKRLKKDGLIESTIIFLYSDHGGGALRTKSKGIALGHQIPMGVIIPEKFEHLNPLKRKKETDQPITFEDFAPTILSLANIKPKPYMTGKPFLGPTIENNEFVFCSSDRCGETNDLVRSVANNRYFYSRIFIPNMSQMSFQKYFDYSITRQLSREYDKKGITNEIQQIPFKIRPFEMLYDLKNDTWQTTNLVNDSNCKDILNKMRIALDEKLLASKDIHFIPEYALDSIAKQRTPYEFKESKMYDFKTIYEVAKKARPGKELLPFQLKSLQSKDPFIRYWASVGLSSQTKEDIKVHKTLLQNSLKDSFAPVEIEIASIVLRMFNSALAKKQIKKYLYHPNVHLKNSALQKVLYYDKELAIEFLDDIKLLSKIHKDKKIQNNFTESLDMYLNLFNSEPLIYKTHW